MTTPKLDFTPADNKLKPGDMAVIIYDSSTMNRIEKKNIGIILTVTRPISFPRLGNCWKYKDSSRKVLTAKNSQTRIQEATLIPASALLKINPPSIDDLEFLAQLNKDQKLTAKLIVGITQKKIITFQNITTPNRSK